MTKDEALEKALNALLWANIEINDWRDDAHGYKPEDQPQIMEAITAIKQARSAPEEPLMVDIHPPATQRDRWMYEQGRLAERDPRSHAAPVQPKPEYKFCDDGKVILKNPEILSQRYRDTTPPAQPAPVQEPVAWGNLANWCLDSDRVLITDKTEAEKYHRDVYDLTPLYTTPPAAQRPVAEPHKWVGLTEQERNDIEDYCEMIIGKPAFEAIEAKLKEKNA